PATAAELNYPPGSRIGLAPPPGLVPSKTFFGYEDPSNSVAMMLVALPPQAYADLDASVTAETLKRQGVTMESREALPLPSGKAFLVVGRQEVDNVKIRKWILVASSPTLTGFVTVQMPETATALYPDAAIRASLATLAFRAAVPVDEQLGLLPFKVGELSGFRIAGVIPGRAVMLSDAPAGAPGSPDSTNEPHIFAAIAAGGPAQSADRDTFAREVFATLPNIREIRVTTSEPLRMAGQQGHQIIADAKDASGTSPLTVVQWLRFGGGGYMQIVGIARADAWKDAYPRFRSVRDGIEGR
ncbi:MAG: hypothetical protein ACXWJL_03395, partial [Xanthobacteraceae bacterium]